MNKTFGYARVSAIDQNLDTQFNELKSLGCDEIYADKITGTTYDRPELNKLLLVLREGDTLIVTRLSRLGRTTIDIINFATQLNAKGIIFKAMDVNIDTSTASGKLIFTVFAAFAQYEREATRERALNGIANAKAKGIHLGRREGVNIDNFNKVKELIGQYSIHQVAKLTGVSVSSVKRYKKKIKGV